jgi:hypothetical protein
MSKPYLFVAAFLGEFFAATYFIREMLPQTAPAIASIVIALVLVTVLNCVAFNRK